MRRKCLWLLVLFVASLFPTMPVLAEGGTTYQIFLPNVSRSNWKLYENNEYGFTAEVPNFSPWVESKAGYYYVANEASVMIIPIWEETGPSVVEFLKKIKQEVGGTFTTILGELPDAPNAVIGGEPAVVLFYPKTPMSPAGFDAFVVHNGRGVRFNCTRPERANALEIYKHVLGSVKFQGLAGEDFAASSFGILDAFTVELASTCDSLPPCPGPEVSCCNNPVSENNFPCCGCTYTYSGQELCNHGNCTWWARQMRTDLSCCTGYPHEWAGPARLAGYIVGSTPAIGAIAILYGGSHVAYTTGVDEEGGGFSVSEMSCGNQRCERFGVHYPSNPSNRFIYTEKPDYPTNITPNRLQFIEVGSDIEMSWKGYAAEHEEYRIKITGQAYLGIDGDPWVYFGPLTTYLETGWISGQSYTIGAGTIPEGLHRIYIASRWKENRLTKGYPASFGSNCFRIGSCDWPGGWNASFSLPGMVSVKLSSVHWCPADIATPTPTPRATITRVVPTATNTPRPANTPTSTTIPFGIPRLVSPSDGSSFTSGDRIVLSWDCPGGCAEAKCLVEREGEVYDSGWTKNLSFVSPINNYGDAKWKVKARKGDLEESDWTSDWTIHIQSTGAIPPRLIDPSKGTIFNYGSQVILRWECRSYECYCELRRDGQYVGSSGWTQNEAGWRLYSNVGCGSFTWRVKGRNQSQSETGWSPTFDFRIVNCPPTATPRLTGTMTATRTRTMTGTATRTATASKTATATRTRINTATVTRTSTRTPVPATSTPVPPTATRTYTFTPRPPPTQDPRPTSTPGFATSTPVPTNAHPPAQPTPTEPSYPTSTPHFITPPLVPTETPRATGTASPPANPPAPASIRLDWEGR